MKNYFNPFEYEAATKFNPDQILNFYIEDFNYSRFISSRRNIFLVGERGSGKSMTLLYNSLPVQLKKAAREKCELRFDIICVYIPCKTPLIYRREDQLLENFQAAVVSEHFLVLATMYAIADTLSVVPGLVEGDSELQLRQEIEFTFDLRLPQGAPFFEALKQAIQKESIITQRTMNKKVADAFYDDARSFSAGVLPLLTSLRSMPRFENSHFALMFDDAHDLNSYQIRALNSWIAYRDNSIFSFKVATAKVNRPTLITASGGTILEDHDFTLVDMEKSYQNQFSDFGKLAHKIIERRLQQIGVTQSPDDFFPVNPQFEKDLEASRKIVQKEAEQKYPHGTAKQIGDHVYKYMRSEYFRQRARKANRPPYSGLDTLVHLSTGVIRNLLNPCYWMYDHVFSDQRHSSEDQTPKIEAISPSVQSKIILERSKRKWDWVRSGLDNSIEDCSREQAIQVYQLFDNLAILFRERLLHHKSEPRAITFTISETDFPHYQELECLLEIARKAQILYTHTSSAKDFGKREVYYVPNRILWPDRGLDPNGQHARVSVKARHLWAAAKENKRIPFLPEEENLTRSLFDGLE